MAAATYRLGRVAVDAETRAQIQEAFEAMARKDLDAWLALHHPDAEISPHTVAVEGRPYRGHAEIREYWMELHASFDEWHPELRRIRDLGGIYLVDLQLRGRGRDSGVTIDQPVWQLIRIRAGKAAWWRIFSSEAEALEFAGRQ
jgi:ketosteroid isomerase-like protein